MITALLTCFLASVAPLTRADTNVLRLVNVHTDLRVLLHASPTNHLEIVCRDQDSGVNHRSNEVVLVVREAAKFTLPGDFPPLGNSGDTLWILPQSQDLELLFLGFSAETILPGQFVSQLEFRLKRVQGPGLFFVWQSATFGQLDFKINTRDGISAADRVVIGAGGHDHYNFGFTTSGVYRVTFTVSGTMSGQTVPLVSPETTFTFEVEPLPAAPPAITAPVLAIARLAAGQATFSFLTQAGIAYQLQSAPAVTGPWTNTGPPHLGNGQRQEISVPLNGSQAFFRAVATTP